MPEAQMDNLGLMEGLFQKSLTDLVKSLRMHSGRGENRYLAQALAEIQRELKASDSLTRVVALQKLTYLHMLEGVDMDGASFTCVQTMALSRFQYKSTGYLAACQSFGDGTEVALLATHLLRKDLTSGNSFEAGLALNCLSSMANKDLGASLMTEVLNLLSSSRLSVRRKATLTLLRLLVRCPEEASRSLPRLLERLQDSDPGVVSAAVSVLCELTLLDPQAYLPLAPDFYRVMVNTSNTWIIIKVVRIFGALAPLEPRLGRKLVGPLRDILLSTSAKSLLLECIRTVTIGLADHPELLNLSMEKLRTFVNTQDSNLRLLGLRALSEIMPLCREQVADQQSAIVACLEDRDPGIQECALKLLRGLVTRETFVPTVANLRQFIGTADDHFTNQLVGTILSMGAANHYNVVEDFPWYLSVLADLAVVQRSTHGQAVGQQLIELAVRAEALRQDAVQVARALIIDGTLLAGSEQHPSLAGALAGACWVVGEYAQYVSNPIEAVEAMLQPRMQLLPPNVQAMYVHAIYKIYLRHASGCERKESRIDYGKAEVSVDGEPVRVDAAVDAAVDATGKNSRGSGQEIGLVPGLTSPLASKVREGILEGETDQLAKLVQRHMPALMESCHAEVQERCGSVLALIDSMPSDGPNRGALLRCLQVTVSPSLRPVAAHAQQRVTVPEGLQLESDLRSLQLLDGASSPKVASRAWGIVEPEPQHQASAQSGTVPQMRSPFYLPATPSGDPEESYPPALQPALEFPPVVSKSGELLVNIERSTSERPRRIRSTVVISLDEDDLPSVHGVTRSSSQLPPHEQRRPKRHSRDKQKQKPSIKL